MPTPAEFEKMWGWYPELVVQMMQDELEAQGFQLSPDEIRAEVRRYYEKKPGVDVTGPGLLVRNWLRGGMDED